MTVTDTTLGAIDTQRVVDIATQLCSIPSEASNELEVAEVVYRALDISGVDLHIEEVVAGRANVVAKVKGAGERAPLVLSGHLDASCSREGWTRDPYAPWIAGGNLYAAGVDDMKGAVAAMIAAVEAASRLDRLPGDLILHAVMHHDTIGLGEKYILASEGPSEGYAICGEPSSLNINTSNGGALKFAVRFHGETAHISRLEGGRDAIAAAVAAYSAIDDLHLPYVPCERLPHLPRKLIGRVEGGFDPGKVASQAIIQGDIRTVPGMGRSDIKKALQEAVEAVCPEGVGVDVRITAVQKPFLGAQSGPLVDAVVEAHTALRGTPPKVTSQMPTQAFVTDAADLAAFGLETIVYGVGDWHFGPDRYVPIDEMADSARVYLAVAQNLSSV